MQPRDNVSSEDDDHPLIHVKDGTERVYREFNSVEEQKDFSNRNKQSVEKHHEAHDPHDPIAPNINLSDFPIDEKDMVLSSLWRQPTPKNGISEESKAKFKSFCKKQFDFSELSELFPDKTIKDININLYRGPRYYPSHGIPPDEEISVVNVEFSDGSSMKVKYAKEVKGKPALTVGSSPQEHKYPNANSL